MRRDVYPVGMIGGCFVTTAAEFIANSRCNLLGTGKCRKESSQSLELVLLPPFRPERVKGGKAEVTQRDKAR